MSTVGFEYTRLHDHSLYRMRIGRTGKIKEKETSSQHWNIICRFGLNRTSRPEDPFLFVPLLLPVVRTYVRSYYEYESYEYVKVCGMRGSYLFHLTG